MNVEYQQILDAEREACRLREAYELARLALKQLMAQYQEEHNADSSIRP